MTSKAQAGKPRDKENPWQTDEVAQLKRLLIAGEPLSGIARVLGRTLGSVAGKADRLRREAEAEGRPMAAPGFGSAKIVKRKLAPRPGAQRFGAIGLQGLFSPGARKVGHVPAPLCVPAGRANPVAFVDRPARSCCWPLWNHDAPLAERMVCGATVGKRTGKFGERIPDSYCPDHRARASGVGSKSEREAA